MESLLLQIIQEHRLYKTDKHTGHSYIPHLYDELFLPYKDEENTILEIGMREGDSMILWREYFQNSTIYGVDNCADPVIKNNEDYSRFKGVDRINAIVGDAYDPEFADTLPNFDIVIDDGPHTVESQIKTIQLYLPKLNPGGVLIIEDIQSVDNMNKINEHIPDEYGENAYGVDLRQHKGTPDDLVIVVKK